MTAESTQKFIDLISGAPDTQLAPEMKKRLKEVNTHSEMRKIVKDCEKNRNLVSPYVMGMLREIESMMKREEA